MNKRQVVSLLESRIVENDANYFAQCICEALEDSGYEVTNEIYDIIGDSYFNLNESSSDEDVVNNIVEHLEAAGYEIDEGVLGRIYGAAKGAWQGAKRAWKGSSREGMNKRNKSDRERRVKKSNKHNAIEAWSSIGRSKADESTQYPNLLKLLETSQAQRDSRLGKTDRNLNTSPGHKKARQDKFMKMRWVKGYGASDEDAEARGEEAGQRALMRHRGAINRNGEDDAEGPEEKAPWGRKDSAIKAFKKTKAKWGKANKRYES